MRTLGETQERYSGVIHGYCLMAKAQEFDRFGGACPPEGDSVHRYRVTIHALSVDKLELPIESSGALAGYMINEKTIESSTIEALYRRD